MRTFWTCSKVIAAVVTVLGAPTLAWAAGCQTYSGTVNWTGPSSNIYINTPVWACVSDQTGRCTSSGGYMDLENMSDKTVMWASTTAGEPVLRPLGPNEKTVRYFPVYVRPGESITADLEVQVCDEVAGTPPGSGNPGSGTPGAVAPGTPGGGGSADNPATYFIDLNADFGGANQWRYQPFTISRATTFDVRLAADYTAQAALIPAGELSNFTGGRAFSGYGLFDGQFGTKTAVTIPPGSYYAAVRNRANGANSIRFEVDLSLFIANSRFLGWDIKGSDFVQPRGGRMWQQLTIAPGVRYFIDGCNSGVDTFVIPAAEIDNFTGGRQFRYYTDYSGQNDKTAPGLWELALPPGTYWLVFRNQDSIAHAVTYQAERWSRSASGVTTEPRTDAGIGRPASLPGDAVAEGLQAAWIDHGALIHLKYSAAVVGSALTVDMFRIALAGDVVSPERVDYDAASGIVTLVVPSLREHNTGSPTVSWNAVPTETHLLLTGDTDPLLR
jgi:hypothetical protein